MLDEKGSEKTIPAPLRLAKWQVQCCQHLQSGLFPAEKGAVPAAATGQQSLAVS